MNKLWLIVKREYIVRVKKKSFILITLLMPLGFTLLMVIPVVIASLSGNDQKQIAVKDDSGILTNDIKATDRANFKIVSESLNALKADYKDKGFDGVLYLPNFKNLNDELRIQYYSNGQLSLSTKEFIERQIARRIRDHKIEAAGYDKKLLKSLETNVNLEQKELTVNKEGELVEAHKKNSAVIATVLGSASAFIIYMILLIYGSMVMRSVMEEKMNRIVEVMISSVKPFQLMLGKILGVSAVGLTQILIWIILIPTVAVVVQLLFHIDASQMQGSMNPAETEDVMAKFNEVMGTLKQQNWGFIIPTFIFYFMGGYFIYAAMFAAVGSAVGDDLGESQSLTLPIMIPIILAFVFMSTVIDNPNSSLATWTSIIPLFSPIIMPARIPFDPPLWEVIVSMVVLVASVVFFIWIAGRIYRVGILMYGKKGSFKELGKWLFYKER